MNTSDYQSGIGATERARMNRKMYVPKELQGLVSAYLKLDKGARDSFGTSQKISVDDVLLALEHVVNSLNEKPLTYRELALIDKLQRAFDVLE